MSHDLRGKTIAITGASSGIGAATAIACARAGMHVAIGARRLDKLTTLADHIRSKGGTACAIELDVANQSSCKKFIEHAANELGNGSIYSVFANAGFGQEASVDESSIEQIREMFEVNVFGSLNVILPAMAIMKRKPSLSAEPTGHVLWCSSCLALLPTPYCGVYSATKAAQYHLGQAMRAECKKLKIEVSTVHPIGTRTAFFDVAVAKSQGSSLITPKDSFFMQDASVVANRVVRCLRKPKAAVWTGPQATLLRYAMAGASAMPSFSGWAIGKLISRRKK